MESSKIDDSSKAGKAIILSVPRILMLLYDYGRSIINVSWLAYGRFIG